MRDLETMQFVTAYPFLLELFNVTDGSKEMKKERVRILEVVESYLVRRMVCRDTSRRTKYSNRRCEVICFADFGSYRYSGEIGVRKISTAVTITLCE